MKRKDDQIRRRLARLEQRFVDEHRDYDRLLWKHLAPLMGSKISDAVENALKICPYWPTLRGTMTPEHVALVLDGFASEDWVSHQRGAAKVASIVYHALAHHEEGKRPLAMPPDVVNAYFEDPDLLPIAHCEICHYRVPTHTEGPDYGLSLFASCPLCGGSVGGEFNPYRRTPRMEGPA